ncbi:hypothetical protein EMCRGX_G006437 [Ephydatia muelleri]
MAKVTNPGKRRNAGTDSLADARVCYGRVKKLRWDDDDSIVKHKLATMAVRESGGPNPFWEAGQLADDYREARKQVENNRGGDFSQKGKQSPSAPEEFELAKGSSKEKHRQRQRWSEDLPVTCFNCIKCGHSDLRHPTNCRSMFSVYPVSNLNLEVGGVPVSVKAAVFKTLQVYVLLGTDVPELGRLLGVTPKNMEENGRKLRSTDGVHQSWC